MNRSCFGSTGYTAYTAPKTAPVTSQVCKRCTEERAGDSDGGRRRWTKAKAMDGVPLGLLMTLPKEHQGT